MVYECIYTYNRYAEGVTSAKRKLREGRSPSDYWALLALYKAGLKETASVERQLARRYLFFYHNTKKCATY